MTAGVTLLLWLEPAAPGWSRTTLLMAESARAVESVQIEYLAPGAPGAASDYDCLVMPGGQCVWRPSGPQVRLAVVGSDGPMPEAQARQLLAVFGNLTQRHGLDLGRVWLHPGSDARLHPELPVAAHDLCALLVRKGVIR